jgi:TPR repeat protein
MRLAIFLAAAVLAGCATYNQDGVNALNRGDLTAAEQQFMQGVQRGDPMSMNNMGVVYERRGNLPAAIQHYTVAARWGVALAQQNLARLGQPVPPADLAAQKAQADAASSAAVANYLRATQPPPMQSTMPISCSSYRMGNSVQTDCR